jgi:phosphonate transport system permease protein
MGERPGAPAHPVTAAPPGWERFTRRQRLARLGARVALALVLVWSARGMGVRWEWIADAPAQLGDLFGRMLPPAFSYWPALIAPLGQTLNIATLGTAGAILLALPVAYLAARNTTPHRAALLLARGAIVVSRSVDSLIWALLFIIVVGPGSLAGALAVAVRSVGFLAKLFAEGIEEIDRGQVEAVTATGAGRLHVLAFGIVPQIRPVFAGVSLFRWDINIRESTVLGIVGAGGIGFVLNEAILGLEWGRVGLILLVILGVVLVSEAVSAWARARLT